MRARPLPGQPAYNDSVMAQPLRPPVGRTGGGVVPGTGGAGAAPYAFAGPSLEAVYERLRYLPVQQENFLLNFAEGRVLLLEPPDIRAFFMIAVSPYYLGSIGLSFNTIPNSPDMCTQILGPGQSFICGNGFVPQNRIYGFCFNAPAMVSVTFANADREAS